MVTPHNEGMSFNRESDHVLVTEGETEFYLKFEVDKVIARLNKKLDIYKRGFKEDERIKAFLYKSVRHNKYKRCLAMTKWCKESLRLMRTYEVTDDYWNLEPGHDAEYFCKKCDFYKKWRKRWLKLAEQFKEAADAR